jgi:hypothetical protein
MTSITTLAEDLSELLEFKERIMERHTLELCPYLGRIKELEDELAAEMDRTHTHEVSHGKYRFSQWGKVLTHKTSRRRREATQRRAIERALTR